MNVLLQTTIPTTVDDWSIARFSLLRDHLARFANVDARDRTVDEGGDDPVLRSIDASAYDQVWLFAVDTGDAISSRECAAFARFRERGGHLLVTRDHEDLGCSICDMGDIGRAHFFHSHNPDPDEANRCRDDALTQHVSWPNFHSGANGDLQTIDVLDPVHELLRSGERIIRRFPAHPHEGAVGVPGDVNDARVIARGTSRATGRPFNIAVAFEGDGKRGRGLAESTFHHFCDYNWDVSKGAPSFVSEPPGSQIERDPHALDDVKAYVTNIANWFGKRNPAVVL